MSLQKALAGVLMAMYVPLAAAQVADAPEVLSAEQDGQGENLTVAGAPEVSAPEAADAAGTQAAAAWAVEGLRLLTPYVAIVGGIEAEQVIQPEDGVQENRITTLALSRFGFRGQIHENVYVESEFEANAGAHGTSAWEGQAALQVRNQLIRLTSGRFRLDVGRVTDLASLNFFSAHIADQLVMDSYTRTALLYAGFNRGNGIYGSVDLVDGLKLGLSFNAANPTSMTGAVMIGGTFPPFSRFYFAPYSNVGRDAASMPSDAFHVYLAAPSLIVDKKRVKARLAYQRFQANTNTFAVDDDRIRGFNVRGTGELVLLGGRVMPFASASFIQNDTVDPTDGYKLSGDLYRSVSYSGGIDLNRKNRDGIGLQYDHTWEQQGEGSQVRQHIVNLGATHWLTTSTSVGVRGALYSYTSDAETFEGPNGERSLFVTVRTLL